MPVTFKIKGKKGATHWTVQTGNAEPMAHSEVHTQKHNTIEAVESLVRAIRESDVILIDDAVRVVQPLWTNLIDYPGALPIEGVEVLGYNKKWEDADFNPDGVCVCVRGNTGYWHVVTMSSIAYEPFGEPTHWRFKPGKPS